MRPLSPSSPSLSSMPSFSMRAYWRSCSPCCSSRFDWWCCRREARSACMQACGAAKTLSKKLWKSDQTSEVTLAGQVIARLSHLPGYVIHFAQCSGTRQSWETPVFVVDSNTRLCMAHGSWIKGAKHCPGTQAKKSHACVQCCNPEKIYVPHPIMVHEARATFLQIKT